MGGFASMNRETGQMRYEQDRADRLWEAVRLWRNGTIEKILITGDGSYNRTELRRKSSSCNTWKKWEYPKKYSFWKSKR